MFSQHYNFFHTQMPHSRLLDQWNVCTCKCVCMHACMLVTHNQQISIAQPDTSTTFRYLIYSIKNWIIFCPFTWGVGVCVCVCVWKEYIPKSL